ncbi:tetratricopeptide repeat protein [Saccharothrix obliqua]|uniref:tetratricopeptide repeat protein n=1 Tax=Saccharothrix obliqua TaxID=2861747 RepID=UPI001C5D348C|nr:hypothetical protein [Saccharothrix obliqua]MBW4717039.1 hypothetical protein [Saccharothrix obliqua]
MRRPIDVLADVRLRMIKGEVGEAADALAALWALLARGDRGIDVAKLHSVSIELADRFPLAEPVSMLMHHATVAYAQLGDFLAATSTAARMVSVWRATCQADPTGDALIRHAHALDTLAAVYRARGMPDEVTGCLVELIEWHFIGDNRVGVAWAVRELGTLALLADDLDNAAHKFARSDEIYAEEGDAAELRRERAECHVLMGRLAYRQGNTTAALHWFGAALEHLAEDTAAEVRAFMRAAEAGIPQPPSKLLPIGEFGQPIWTAPPTSRNCTKTPITTS